jgi:hypothetical protein
MPALARATRSVSGVPDAWRWPVVYAGAIDKFPFGAGFAKGLALTMAGATCTST